MKGLKVGTCGRIFLGSSPGGGGGGVPCLYHLSSLENRLVSDFLVWDGSSYLFSFGFSCSLSYRKVTEVAFLLSLLKAYSLRKGI